MLFKTFCDEVTREVNRTRIKARTTLQAARIEVKRISRELDKIMQVYLDAEVIRSLLTEIVLTPEDSALQIDVRGDLAGILTIALGRKAGTQNGRPGERAADLIEQVKLVAGARSHLYRTKTSM